MVTDNSAARISGGSLRVLIVARVSDPGHGKQDPRSVEDQEALVREWIARNIDEPYEIEVLAGSGSGENLDRKEFLELTDRVAARQYDLIVTEDLGRIVRRLRAHMFCEECVDSDVRLVAINDHVDTSEEGWQDRSFFSSWHHERSNRDTSDRIKRAHRSRFRSGGCAAIPIYGYIKPPDAKCDEDWRKDPAAEPIYQEWFERLDRGESFEEISDWLNERRVPTGPYCRSERWTGTIVGQVSRNILLKGQRYRNRRISRRDSRGKYRSHLADPELLLTREVPHLAFVEPAEYDRIMFQVDERNDCYRRGKNGSDSRRGVPRKRTRFPGQVTYCGVCGRKYVFGGHGQKHHLMCDGARKYRCWNGISFEGPLAARRIASAVMDVFQALPEFDETFLEEVNAEANRLDNEKEERLAQIDVELRQAEQKINHLVNFISSGHHSQAIANELQELESQQRKRLREAEILRQQPQHHVTIPSADELREQARISCDGLSEESWEFCKFMQRLVPRIVVFPHRLCDGGPPVLRARFRVRPAEIISDRRCQDLLSQPLEAIRTVNLFDPPQRAAFRAEVMELRRAGLNHREIGKRLGITNTASQRAAILDRRTNELGLTDPYISLDEPPHDYRKMQRHRHRRYRFEPLPDAGTL